MLIATKTEQITLLSNDVKESLASSSPVGSNPDFFNGLPPVSDSPDSPLLSTGFCDVNVVPEHEKSQLEQCIQKLQGEIDELRSMQRSVDEKRREMLNKILDIKGTIRVFCRVRPFLWTDKRRTPESVSSELDRVVVGSCGSRKEFGFDKVFHQEANQEDVFVEVEPILRSALDGHNACVFAYGQTGTGKTFTMDGTMDQPGIVPRALKELFQQVSSNKSSSFTFSMSMLEVYLGNLRDLLASKPASRDNETVAKCNLNIQTDPKGSVEIEGLTQVEIPDFAKARWWYAKGRRARSTSWTNVNEASSRSHCLIRIVISRLGDTPDAKPKASKLWMVDLGGSERLLKTGATGHTLDEGRAINLSLSALGDVIAALRRKRGHVPYRQVLGVGSKILMLVHISPCHDDLEETICSLSFAKRAKAIDSNRRLPEDLKKLREKRISELEENMREVEEECRKLANQISRTDFLLSENRKLYATAYGIPDKIVEKNPENCHDAKIQVVETPRVTKKPIQQSIHRSLPRFMTSTVASRERQIAAEREIIARARTLRPGTRSSMQVPGFQSLSFSDNRFRSLLRHSTRSSRFKDTNGQTIESPKCNDSAPTKPTSSPRGKVVTSSDPNLRVKLGHHRRRMSDFV
ncbi:Transducin/WD40 repeat-like superfamily protein isoform 1 [Hibiscus syriacus]|uniref:Transducin/WD40 repeat-like superfamily protein isoform 1 n=1 Tax=Hibiscus syriacus TaxID=106335 RepID=A0A6A2YIH6_HIBSY|nr:Transducin/WD40 repeat-like superfamily protein isoform 1 [Hibiscus syriacus]